MNMEELIKKYDVAGPRYTSYPTVPAWNTADFNIDNWEKDLQISFHNNAEIGIYIHLPYCESLCTFCACHKHITVNHDVETSYINAVLHEWKLYTQFMTEKPILNELHLGGGTPSFFAPEQLERLVKGILQDVTLAPDFEMGFEGHPMNTTENHLQTLYNLGFRRVSFGVQDYNKHVQKAIHRHQPFEAVKKVTEAARNIGYTSISHDLVYGLPFQTLDSITDTVEKTLNLHPDRLSFYSYAHVPWIKGNGQRGFKDSDLPSGAEKRKLYDLGKKLFEATDYEEIGMDHFAKKTDTLFKARERGRLHRNFMGYTHHHSRLLIGLGVSSIGNTHKAYMQNEKNIGLYSLKVQQGLWPITKGHLLNETDVLCREIIEDIMCNFKTDKLREFSLTDSFIYQKLEDFENDGLLTFDQNQLHITDTGKTFVRNIAMLFDQYLHQKEHKQTFSKTI